MTEEHSIQNSIRAALSDICVIFRINVGSGFTQDGRCFQTGVPSGFSDLFGFRKSDGKAVFIEVKTKSGKTTLKQKNFIQQMQLNGAIAGVCRNVEDAIKLVKDDKNGI